MGLEPTTHGREHQLSRLADYHYHTSSKQLVHFTTGEDIEEVILLLDSRRVPNEMDLQMFQWILAATGYEPIVIITKMDKLKRSQHAKAIKEIREKLGASKDCIMIPFSAETKSGREEFLELVDKILLENS